MIKNIEHKIKKIVSEQLELPLKKILNSSSYNDLNADSLDVVELIMNLEKEFDIEISDKDAEKITNIQNTINYIFNKMNK